MRAAAVVLVLAVVVARPARAFEEFQGTRALGMGGATRAWAVAESGPLLNPSGMTLIKAYSVEASYAFASRLTGQFIHASIVDSTSAANLSGALYYTYRMDSASGRPSGGHGHEGGASLALPLGNYLSLGGTAKYFRLAGADQGPTPSDGGFTFDVGATVRASANVALAVVGSNLRNLEAGQAPRMLSYGVAFGTSELVVAVDGVTSFTRDDVLLRKGTGGQAGFEWTLAQRVAIRGGGGYDPMLGVGYLSGGLSALSEVGAVDVGVRGDLFRLQTGSERNVFLGISLRLFVPAVAPTAP